MAFFNKKKKREIPAETSADIARQRAEEIHNNYDTDVSKEPEKITQPPEDDSPEDLDQLFDSGLNDDMLTFEDDEVEEDLAKQETPLEESDEEDLFAGIELPSTEGHLSEVDESFKDLYEVEESLDGDVLTKNDTISEDEEIPQEETLAQPISSSLEEEVIKSDSEHESSNGMANARQIYMAMQAFDSEDGDFDLENVDSQLIFDTDDEDGFGFSCNADKGKENISNEDAYIFDSSDEV